MLVSKILKNREDHISGPPFECGLVCYTSYQPEYYLWPQYFTKSLTFYQGFPTEDKFLEHSIAEKENPSIFIVDDSCQNDAIFPLLTKLFTTYSHHCNISVIFISHGLFLKNRLSVLLMRNSAYLILFDNPRDRSSIRTLGSQIFPKDPYFLLSCFEIAAAKPYGFLLCDFKTSTPPKYRFRETFCRGDGKIAFYENEKTIQDTDYTKDSQS